MTTHPHTCDCGQPADHRDGSGYSCPACRTVVSALQDWLARYIRLQRHLDTLPAQQLRRALYWSDYSRRHRRHLQAYQRAYQARHNAFAHS